MNEVIDIEHMPEINKAIASASLFWLLLVHRQSQIIEPVLMILLKVSPDLSVGVSARYVLDHQVGLYLFIVPNLIVINWASVVFTDVGYEALLRILLLHHVMVQSIDVLIVAMVVTASSMTTYCSQQDIVHLIAREVMMNFKSTSVGYPFETCRQWIVCFYFVGYVILAESFGVVLVFSS